IDIDAVGDEVSGAVGEQHVDAACVHAAWRSPGMFELDAVPLGCIRGIMVIILRVLRFPVRPAGAAIRLPGAEVLADVVTDIRVDALLAIDVADVYFAWIGNIWSTQPQNLLGAHGGVARSIGDV